MWESELAFAHEIADRADVIAMDLFRGEFEVRRKADRTPVTEADLAIEAMVREAVAERFPGDVVLGEETGQQGDAERVWIVDPIDSTKNFAAGIQIWGTLLALRAGEHLVLGLVSAPALGERYEATLGGGARCNGEPIRVSDVEDLSRAHVLFGGVRAWLETPQRDAFLDLLAIARRTRGFGDFWAHMLVARGAADVMLEPELRVWDWAALSVIVEEAGGRITRLDGGPPTDRGGVLTTNGRLHDEVLGRLGGG